MLRGGDSPVTVRLDGGELEVDVDESLHVDLTGWAVPVYARRAERGAGGRARVDGMTETQSTGAWAIGLATFAGERMLDAWFPEPHLSLEGAPAHPGTREVQGALAGDLMSAARGDDLRGVRVAAIATVLADLAQPPADTADAYLRLHLLSHRLIRPHGANLDGIFGVLPNVAWTSAGPVDPAALDAVRLRFRAAGQPARGLRGRQVPADGRLRRPAAACGSPTPTACGSARTSPRARPSCTRASSTTTPARSAPRWSRAASAPGVVVGDGSDVGGGASIMGTLSGGGTEVISVGERCLLGANSGLGHLARRRLHGRGRPLRHRRDEGRHARRRGRQGGRAERRRRAAVPPQLADGRRRGAPALGQLVAA